MPKTHTLVEFTIFASLVVGVIVFVVWYLVKDEVFLQMCGYGNTGIVKLFLANGMPLDTRDGWNSSCMFYAAGNGHIDLVELLLDRGVDINRPYRMDKTALIIAAQAGKADTVRFLIDKGADTQLKDQDGRKALDHAKQNKHVDVEKILTK